MVADMKNSSRDLPFQTVEPGSKELTGRRIVMNTKDKHKCCFATMLALCITISPALIL